jgi:hypothetical protein
MYMRGLRLAATRSHPEHDTTAAAASTIGMMGLDVELSVVAVAWPVGVGGVCHGVCVGDDLWDAYDRMGLSFQQHAADSAYNAHYGRPAVLPHWDQSRPGRSWTQPAARPVPA